MRIRAYEVVQSDSLDVLIHSVHYWLAHGWQPVGAMQQGHDCKYYQTMVSYDALDSEPPTLDKPDVVL